MTVVLSTFAAYVWIAYGISLVALGLTTFVTIRQWWRIKRLLANLQDSETNL